VLASCTQLKARCGILLGSRVIHNVIQKEVNLQPCECDDTVMEGHDLHRTSRHANYEGTIIRRSVVKEVYFMHVRTM